jgi:hypothetical protein
MLYVLMSEKTRNAYRFLFREIKDRAADLNIILDPLVITSDFESGLLPAIADVFPQARVQGCFFHFCQAVYRFVQHHGLAVAYQHHDPTRDTVRQLMGLAFLPADLVPQIFQQLREIASPLLAELFEYFSAQWLTKIPLWNVYGVRRRTNNNLEGWHLRFNRIVGHHHPNIWTLLNALKSEQQVSETTILQVEAGQSVGKTILYTAT